MVFTSAIFIFIFLPIFLVSYHLTPKSYKNILLLVASLVFYVWGAPKFIIVLLLSLFSNYYIVNKMTKVQTNKKVYLFVSLFLNIGLLAFFKYANFFVNNVNFTLTHFGFSNIEWVKIALPIGISFFTFQSITYTIDVYRGKCKPLSSPWNFILYIIMFPQLIAGPIVRYNTIAKQIETRTEKIEDKLSGIFRFIIGLSKKVLLANTIGEHVDVYFSAGIDNMSTPVAWLVIIGYSFQLYFDFSGYSDMAIGLGKILGFKFPENFNSPYIAKSISEFWRRWHITLSEFMREYLYIPLGGNRVNSNYRLYTNLFIVFFLSGLWHGAAWNFILWGIFHGIFLIVERIFLLKLLKKAGSVVSIIYSNIVVITGWALFKIENLPDLSSFLKKMYIYDNTPNTTPFELSFTIPLIIAIIFSYCTLFKFGKQLDNFFFKQKIYTNSEKILISLLMFVLLIISCAYIVGSDFNPFIYFRF